MATEQNHNDAKALLAQAGIAVSDDRLPAITFGLAGTLAQVQALAKYDYARTEIAAIKVVAPNLALRVLERAIQAHGAAGVGPDFPLAAWWANARTLRLADGPDEVHLESIAKWELSRPSTAP